jgi:hypothetical protein
MAQCTVLEAAAQNSSRVALGVSVLILTAANVSLAHDANHWFEAQ